MREREGKRSILSQSDTGREREKEKERASDSAQLVFVVESECAVYKVVCHKVHITRE